MTQFTEPQLTFIKAKFNFLTSKEIFNHLVVNFAFDRCYTNFRTKCYANGLYKCKMRRWTADEKKFLRDNYQTMGNIKIAENLSKKGRIFNKKQIEKQMKLLKLKRSPENLTFILNQNKNTGVYSKANYKRWEEKKHKDGDLVTWNLNNVPRVMIKIDGSFLPYARYRYTQIHGPIENGFKVFFKDCNPLNIEDENLYLSNRSLTRENREAYKKNIAKYLLQQNLRSKEIPAIVEKEKAKPKEALITVVINDKVRLRVKPGTDVEKLKSRYISALKNNWETSN